MIAAHQMRGKVRIRPVVNILAFYVNSLLIITHLAGFLVMYTANGAYMQWSVFTEGP